MSKSIVYIINNKEYRFRLTIDGLLSFNQTLDSSFEEYINTIYNTEYYSEDDMWLLYYSYENNTKTFETIEELKYLLLEKGIPSCALIEGILKHSGLIDREDDNKDYGGKSEKSDMPPFLPRKDRNKKEYSGVIEYIEKYIKKLIMQTDTDINSFYNMTYGECLDIIDGYTERMSNEAELIANVSWCLGNQLLSGYGVMNSSDKKAKFHNFYEIYGSVLGWTNEDIIEFGNYQTMKENIAFAERKEKQDQMLKRINELKKKKSKPKYDNSVVVEDNSESIEEAYKLYLESKNNKEGE